MAMPKLLMGVGGAVASSTSAVDTLRRMGHVIIA